MRWAGWIWTALCTAAPAVAFFALPAWDTSAAGYGLSGTEVFVPLAVLLVAIWIVGLVGLGVAGG